MDNLKNTPQSDEELAEDLKRGSMESFKILYERYKLKIYNYLCHLLGDRSMAEDCTQDLFIQMYHKASLYHPTAKFSSWLYKMAKNIALDAFRKNKIRKSISLDKPLYDEESGVSSVSLNDLLPAQGQDPALLASNHELAALLEKAISQLSEKDREIIVLCDIQGLPHKEAGDILGCSEQTLTVKLYRARKKLAEILKIKGDF